MENLDKFTSPQISELLFPALPELQSAEGASPFPVSLDKDSSVRCSFYGVDQQSPSIIFFPSTVEGYDNLEAMAQAYNRQQLNIMIVSYRNSNGQDQGDLAAFFQDGHKIFEACLRYLQDNSYSAPVFVMGQALGAVLAIDIVAAHAEALKGMILEGTSCNLASYLAHLGGEVIEDCPDCSKQTLELIETIDLPTLIFHGASDSVTSIPEAERLQASSGAKSKQYFIIPGGKHKDLYITGGALYFQTIKKFTDTVCGINTWRQRRKKFREE